MLEGGKNITIAGGKVTANGGDYGAGIGGGQEGDGSNITITVTSSRSISIPGRRETIMFI